MFHGSADLVFITNKKKIKIVVVLSTSNLGARLCGYQYVVSLTESIATWSQSRMAVFFVVVTTVCFRRKFRLPALPLRYAVVPGLPNFLVLLERNPPAFSLVAHLAISCQFQNCRH